MIQIDPFHVVGAIIAFIVWLVRLEGKVNHGSKMNEATQKDVDDLRLRHETLDSKIVEKLAEISERLARIEGGIAQKEK